MDKISCIAYLLFQADDPIVKEAALKLVAGDLSLKEVKNTEYCRPYLEIAEAKLKNHDQLTTDEVCRFVEEYLFVL
ncbi:hypothetical protein WAK64_16690 [Bacillus spongiae]|uniref:Uncharacterized protein n=1 Tax=Bacillus spongiae TaxID=2683610 RepID=A0ABU8HHC7_9BACI